jgi:hypothetical protein
MRGVWFVLLLHAGAGALAHASTTLLSHQEPLPQQQLGLTSGSRKQGMSFLLGKQTSDLNRQKQTQRRLQDSVDPTIPSTSAGDEVDTTTDADASGEEVEEMEGSFGDEIVYLREKKLETVEARLEAQNAGTYSSLDALLDAATKSGDYGMFNFIILGVMISMTVCLLLCACLNDPCGCEELLLATMIDRDCVMEVVHDSDGERIGLLSDEGVHRGDLYKSTEEGSSELMATANQEQEQPDTIV